MVRQVDVKHLVRGKAPPLPTIDQIVSLDAASCLRSSFGVESLELALRSVDSARNRHFLLYRMLPLILYLTLVIANALIQSFGQSGASGAFPFLVVGFSVLMIWLVSNSRWNVPPQLNMIKSLCIAMYWLSDHRFCTSIIYRQATMRRMEVLAYLSAQLWIAFDPRDPDVKRTVRSWSNAVAASYRQRALDVIGLDASGAVKMAGAAAHEIELLLLGDWLSLPQRLRVGPPRVPRWQKVIMVSLLTVVAGGLVAGMILGKLQGDVSGILSAVALPVVAVMLSRLNLRASESVK